MEDIYDLIIIGGGPAGLTAALYASRANLKILIVEKDSPGGKITKTSSIENWPGQISVMGPDLAYKMYEQVMSYKPKYVYGDVVKVEVANKERTVTLTDQKIYRAKAIIVATGTVENKLGIPGESKYYGKGVSYCAVCDGALYADKDIAVIGGGNSALEEANYLTKFAKKVYLVHRRSEFRAEPIIVKHAKNNNKIEMHLNYEPVSINGSEIVDELVIKKENEIVKLAIAAVFPFVGLSPATSFLAELNILTDKGYVITDENMQTTIPGIYAAGDVINKSLRQIVTAVNDGAIAAQSVIKYLDTLSH